jgi:acyl dehydratase
MSETIGGERRTREAWRTEIDLPVELLGLVGQKLGTSPWLEVTQEDVDDFARLTGDEQWIHVDPERAAAGPFGTTSRSRLSSKSKGTKSRRASHCWWLAHTTDTTGGPS